MNAPNNTQDAMAAFLPKYIWADYDPEYPRDVRWSFYRTRSEQRGNRPDLKAIKMRIVPNNEKNRPGGSSPGATMRERTDMQTINQPGEPARENRGTGSGERGAGSLRAALTIEGIGPEDARKAYRVWGRACAAMTTALRRDFGAQVNVILRPEGPR